MADRVRRPDHSAGSIEGVDGTVVVRFASVMEECSASVANHEALPCGREFLPKLRKDSRWVKHPQLFGCQAPRYDMSRRAFLSSHAHIAGGARHQRPHGPSGLLYHDYV